MELTCKVCDKSFKSDKGLHVHVSRTHKIEIGEYYVNFYQRKDRYDNKLLSFKNKSDYFSLDFRSRKNLISGRKAPIPTKSGNIYSGN